MKKILFVTHDFNNYGGIINHTEQLMAGFKDLGHQADLICIKPSAKEGGKLTKNLEKYVVGEGSGFPIHQGNGWGVVYQPFLSSNWIESFVKKANEYDVIIWESIFGFKCQETEGQTQWVKMIQDVDKKVKQIAIVHDGNLLKFYPWIWHLRDSLSGLACVHPSAFSSAEQMEIPRMLIVNPQKAIQRNTIPFSQRKNQILSLQTFKRWKRVDDLVAAIPHAPEISYIIAGDGIERAYMASVEKCKPEYYCTLESDPKANVDMLNKRIWENASNYGMKYLGFISEDVRDTILQESKFLIDTSWSKTYGSHFNRVIVDAMRVGTVPIARNLGVSSSESGVSDFFKPEKNYLMIPWDVKPYEFAGYLKKFMGISEKKYSDIVERNYQIVSEVFSRETIALQYLALAQGFRVEAPSVGLTDKKVKETIDDLWCGHFGFNQKLVTEATLDAFF